jgi:hypothetical protein
MPQTIVTIFTFSLGSLLDLCLSIFDIKELKKISKTF